MWHSHFVHTHETYANVCVTVPLESECLSLFFAQMLIFFSEERKQICVYETLFFSQLYMFPYRQISIYWLAASFFSPPSPLPVVPSNLFNLLCRILWSTEQSWWQHLPCLFPGLSIVRVQWTTHRAECPVHWRGWKKHSFLALSARSAGRGTHESFLCSQGGLWDHSGVLVSSGL